MVDAGRRKMKMMNRAKNIILFWNGVVTAIAAMFLASSCVKEPQGQRRTGIEGTEEYAEVSIGFSSMNAETATRADDNKLADPHEAVNDLYILVFDANGKRVHLDRNRYTTWGDSKNLLRDNVPDEGYTATGLVKITLPIDRQLYIAALANIGTSSFKDNVEESLNEENVPDISTFRALTLGLAHPGATERPGNIAMSGWYKLGKPNPEGEFKGLCPVTVLSTSLLKNTLDNTYSHVDESRHLVGYISLRRMDASVKFEIYNCMGKYLEEQALDKTSEAYIHSKQEIASVDMFRILSWRVMRLPDGTKACEQEGEDGYEGTYSDSPASNYISSIGGETNFEKKAGFSFYMWENRKKPKLTEGLDSYNLRDKIKPGADGNGQSLTADGRPDWVYANDNSTYVEIRAYLKLDMYNDPGDVNSGTYQRTADVTYRVHLGDTYAVGADGQKITDSENGPKDFTTARNTRYTYRLYIYGVDKIVVEAKRESDDNDANYHHGVEGTVTDSDDGHTIMCDAHYHEFNVSLNRKAIDMLYVVMTSYSRDNGKMQTPDESSRLDKNTTAEQLKGMVTDDMAREDYYAIRIAPAESMEKMTDFSTTYDRTLLGQEAWGDGWYPNDDPQMPWQVQDDTHTVPLYDIVSWLNTYKETGNETTDNETLYFTVFVNEAVYYRVSDWGKWINQNARTWMFMPLASNVSKDGHSIYAKSRIHITQQSVQSFFKGNSTADKAVSAIGAEHENEYFGKNFYKTDPTDISGKLGNGWSYTAYNPAIHPSSDNGESFAKWNDIMDLNTCLTYKGMYPVFIARKQDYNSSFPKKENNGYYYDVMRAVMSRNRDLNRDGLIQPVEIRWFLPDQKQVIELVTGRSALADPLFDPKDYEKSVHGDIYENGNFHFWASDGKYIWAEEGYSTADSDTRQNYARIWNMRCVRYIGLTRENTIDPANTPDKPGAALPEECLRLLSKNGSKIWALKISDNANDAVYTSAWSFVSKHEVFNKSINRPPRIMLVAAPSDKLPLKVPDSYFKDYPTLVDSLYSHPLDFCVNEDKSDLGKWRVPNITEFAFIWNQMRGDVTRKIAGKGRFISCSSWQSNFTSQYTNGVAENSKTGDAFFLGCDKSNLNMTHPQYLYHGGGKDYIQEKYVWPVRSIDENSEEWKAIEAELSK